MCSQYFFLQASSIILIEVSVRQYDRRNLFILVLVSIITFFFSLFLSLAAIHHHGTYPRTHAFYSAIHLPPVTINLPLHSFIHPFTTCTPDNYAFNLFQPIAYSSNHVTISKHYSTHLSHLLCL